MESNKEPVKAPPSRALAGRAMDAVLQFFLRTLTPINRPLTAVREAPPLPEDDQLLKVRKQSFSGEMFAELLLELPMHRRRLITWPVKAATLTRSGMLSTSCLAPLPTVMRRNLRKRFVSCGWR